MTYLKPVNKTLLVEREPVPEKKNDLGIFVPSSTQKVENVLKVKLVACEDKSTYEKYVGCYLLVNSHMLQDIEVKNIKGTFISENGVIAVITESDVL